MRTSQKATEAIWMRNPGGLNKGSGNEDEEKMMVLKHILKVEMTGLGNGLGLRWKERKESG